MPYSANIYKVFIASPSDVSDERKIIRETIDEWNVVNGIARQTFLLPVGWDTHSYPEIGDRAQAIINKQVLKDSDLLVGVFWTRLGTPTGGHESGTVEEIEEHIANGRPAMIYFSSVPVVLDSVDTSQYVALKAFKEKMMTRGLVATYSDLTDFARQLSRQLQHALNKMLETHPQPVSQPSDVRSPIVPSVSQDAIDLLHGAIKQADGKIYTLRSGSSGLWIVQLGNHGTLDTSTPRLSAKWRGVIEELCEAGLLGAMDASRTAFEVTDKGYRATELFPESP